MAEKRVFPRIVSDWPLFLQTAGGQEEIGYIKNISLSGTLLYFSKDYRLEAGKSKFMLKLKNQQLDPPELLITGLKEWTEIRENEVLLGLILEELPRDERTTFIRFLSRSEKLQVEAFLVEGSEP
ncbi:hypothetical protein ES703_21089 [subsurface metagenome]